MENFRIKAEQMKLKMRKICSWCDSVMDEGEKGAITTHVMCESCAEEFLRQINFEKEPRCGL